MDSVRSLAKKYPRRTVVFIALLCSITVLYFYFSQSGGLLRITFLDVGQGDAVLITAPNGNRLLYDAGPPTRAIIPALSQEFSYFDRNLAILVASHPDADHIGGFPDVLDAYHVLLYLDAHTFSRSADFLSLENILSAKHIERRTIGRGTRIALGGGVLIDVLSPAFDNMRTLSTNDASVVLHVHYGSTSLLLSGDMETKEEQRLVDTFGEELHATILKAGHHGSKSSTSAQLLAAVHPQFVVLSVGAQNRYGHPHPAAINRIQESGATILSTALNGSIHFSCTIISCKQYD